MRDSIQLYFTAAIDLGTKCATDSVNRLGHFGKKLKAFGQLLIGSFIFWQKFEPTLANFYAIGQINILINGQILKNNLGSYMTDDNI